MTILDAPWMPTGYRERYANLQEQLARLTRELDNPIAIAQKGAEISRQAFGELRDYVVQHPFTDEREEILFFKQIKPSFYCHLFYYVEVYRTEVQRPVGGPKIVQVYLERRLQELYQFQIDHMDFYAYYRSGSTRLDFLYFVRGAWKGNADLYPCLLDVDPAFGSSHDYLVARIMAHELLARYLLEGLERVKGESEGSRQSSTGENSIQWTGSKAWLNELIYGLKESGVLNKGNTTVGEIAHALELAFHVPVGNVYRRQQENRLRDRPTPFFDFMKEKYLAYINRVDDNPHSSTR